MKNDQQLLKLLRENSRRSVSDMAAQLGVIQSYTIKLNPNFERQQVSAYVMISVVGSKTTDVVRQLQKYTQLDMLSTISGQYDLIAKVTEENTEALDRAIDNIATLDGVEKTLSHIVLSRKLDR